MTRIAYFQPFSGISGDMALGALIDAGLSAEALKEGLSSLRLPGWDLLTAREMRGPFQATRLKVLLEKEDRAAHDDRGSPASQPHGHAVPSTHAARAHQEHRHLEDIVRIIEGSSLPAPVKASSVAVFTRLAGAEARVHGIPVDQVHFHEVGALDSIIDIVGFCLGIHILEIDEVRSAPVTVGTGFVSVAHGQLPLPAPATLELLRGLPVEQRDSRAELTTPTGAALLSTLSRSFGTFPPLVVSSIGYGAGDDRPGPVPNVLRVVLGDTTQAAPSSDRIVVLESNIDDMSPQWLGYLMDRLFEAGALDVSLTPIVMKKSRAAHEIKVLVPLELEAVVLRTLFAESTTFGVRRMEADRAILEREIRSVETPWGPVRVKVGRLGGEIVTVSPEFEDLRAAASRAGLPLKEIHRRVLDLVEKGAWQSPPVD